MQGINKRELTRYVRRVSDRWRLERALLGGARVADALGALAQRERGAEYVVVLVSGGFDGVPWLSRVYQAASLWDAHEMDGPADVHCYTPAEFERRAGSVPAVRTAVEHGFDLLAPNGGGSDGSPFSSPSGRPGGYEPPDGVAPV
jgi:hypothetical protein